MSETGHIEKPIESWTDTDVLALPVGEFSWLEFKDSRFIKEGDWTDKLSRYLSAWANYDGGYLVVGFSDPSDGELKFDGGFNVEDQKKWSDRLDKTIPGLVEPKLRAFNTRFVSMGSTGGSALVVRVPESEDAPHQAKDLKYYARRGRHLDPLGHRAIEDMRNRRRYPRVRVDLKLTMGRFKGKLLWTVHNTGRVMAKHVMTRIKFPTMHQGEPIAFENDVKCYIEEDEKGEYLDLSFRNGINSPLFPGGELFSYADLRCGGLRTEYYGEKRPSIEEVRITTFADEMPALIERFTIEEIASLDLSLDYKD